MKQCTFCGAELPDDALACNNCGRPFPDMVSPDGEILRPKKAEEPEPVKEEAREEARPAYKDDRRYDWDPRVNGWNEQAEKWQENGGQPDGQRSDQAQQQQGGWNEPQQPQQQSPWGRQEQQDPWGRQDQRDSWGRPEQQDQWGRPQGGPWYPQGEGAGRPGYGNQQRLNSFAMTSLMLGIMAAFFNGFLFIPSVVAIVFGIVSLYQFKKEPQLYRGRWMAFVGIALAVVFLVVYIILYIRVFNNLYSAVQDPETFQQLQEYLGMTGR